MSNFSKSVWKGGKTFRKGVLLTWTILSHSYFKKSVKSSAQGKLYSVTRFFSIPIQCSDVNLPTIQLLSLHNTAHQSMNSSRANTQIKKPVVPKSKQLPWQAHMTHHKMHSLGSSIGNVINLIYLYVITICGKQTFAFQQRLRFKRIYKHPYENKKYLVILKWC